MSRQRIYTEDILAAVEALRGQGVKWTDIEAKYGKGVRIAWYNRGNYKPPAPRVNVWYPVWLPESERV